MLTIGQVSKKYSLSRSTLIYYDSIGLLRPSGRSGSNYRLYSDSDLLRMDKIALLRETGLSLKSITTLVDRKEDALNRPLEQRLEAINSEIQGLRNQQNVILKLLQNQHAVKGARVMSKQAWVSLLEAAGMDDTGMKKWHIEFEKTSPEAHQDFLESIGIETAEIVRIRARSKSADI